MYFAEFTYPDCIPVLLKQPLLLGCILMIVQDTIGIQSGNSWDTVSQAYIEILSEYTQNTGICVHVRIYLEYVQATCILTAHSGSS